MHVMKSPLGWVLLGAAAVILLPYLWGLLKLLLGLTFGILQIAAVVLVVLFVIALIRRMLVAR
jgi:hypothetical protein